MTPAVNVVYVPVLVPVAGNTHWLIPRPPPYPRERRDQWPPKTSVPVRNEGQVRNMLAEARKMISQDRASRLLRELRPMTFERP
jgi:hypothetical protein